MPIGLEPLCPIPYPLKFVVGAWRSEFLYSDSIVFPSLVNSLRSLAIFEWCTQTLKPFRRFGFLDSVYFVVVSQKARYIQASSIF